VWKKDKACLNIDIPQVEMESDGASITNTRARNANRCQSTHKRMSVCATDTAPREFHHHIAEQEIQTSLIGDKHLI
jgi:hypothetical protein